MVKDPNWRPKAGDRVVVYQVDAHAVADPSDFDTLAKSLDANDQVGLKDLRDRKLVSLIPANTPVLVVKVEGLPTYYGRVVTNGADLHAEMQANLLRSAGQPRPRVSIEVRVLEGPGKGTLVTVPMESLARLVPETDQPTRHQPGRKMVVGVAGADVLEDWAAFQDNIRSATGLPADKVLFTLRPGTKVVVVEYDENPAFAARVRVLSGPKHVGRVGYVSFNAISNPEPVATPDRNRDATKPDPAARATVQLQVAGNLEKSGNRKAAVDSYRQIVRDFPGTPAAQQATARLKAIEGK